jgi:hypothetical protein
MIETPVTKRSVDHVDNEISEEEFERAMEETWEGLPRSGEAIDGNLPHGAKIT